MKKLWIAMVIGLLLSGCNPVSSPPALPMTAVVATSVPAPIQSSPTITPTAIPSIHVNSRSLVHLNSMTEVSEPDGTTSVWTVGDDGYISRISQDGYISRIDSPVREYLYDIDFVSSEDGWIVGANSLILHWNENRWEVSQPASKARWPYSYDLYSVAFSEADDGWAAGCTGSEGGQYFLVEHWDGLQWSKVPLPNEWNLWVCAGDVLALSPTNVWITGGDWNEGKELGATIHWDGKEWKLFKELQSYTLSSLSALASDRIWGITQNGIVLNWDGIEWQEQAQLDSTNIIFAQDKDDIFAVGTKIWYWNGDVWNDLSLSGDFPSNADLKGIIAPHKGESGYADPWLLDSSGKIYTFTHPRVRRI